MVKKWVVIICLIVLLLVGCIVESNYVNKSFDFLYNELNKYETMISMNEEIINTQSNIDYIDNLHKQWHKKVKVLKALIWHSGIKDVEIGLSRIKTYTEENDYTEAKAELKALLDFIKHYSDDFAILVENIL